MQKLLITVKVHLNQAFIIKQMVLLKLKPEFHFRISLAADEVYSLYLISDVTVYGGWLFTQAGVNFSLRILRGDKLGLNIVHERTFRHGHEITSMTSFCLEIRSMTTCSDIKDAVIRILIGFVCKVIQASKVLFGAGSLIKLMKQMNSDCR